MKIRGHPVVTLISHFRRLEESHTKAIQRPVEIGIPLQRAASVIQNICTDLGPGGRVELDDELSTGLPINIKVSPSHPGLASYDSENYGFGGYDQPIGGGLRKMSVPLRFWGMPYRSIQVSEDVAAQQPIGSPVTSAREKKPTPPQWLEGTYRPRALTEAGAHALELLAPGAEGLTPFPSRQLASLEERRKYLAMRYVALDLLKLGLVVEANGHYRHVDNKHFDSVGIFAKMKLTRSDCRMHEQDMIAMLAVGRMMSLDQIILAEPENARNNAEQLWEMEENGLVERHQIVHGKGNWEAYALSDRTWRQLHREHPDLSMLGIKSRRPSGNNRDLHESLQVDALAWFVHELVDAGGFVLKLSLDRALRQNAFQNGGGRFLDFRLHYQNDQGMEGIEDIEVIGIGSAYRSRSKCDAINHCAVHRSFSAGADRIAMGKHVCIGR